MISIWACRFPARTRTRPPSSPSRHHSDHGSMKTVSWHVISLKRICAALLPTQKRLTWSKGCALHYGIFFFVCLFLDLQHRDDSRLLQEYPPSKNVESLRLAWKITLYNENQRKCLLQLLLWPEHDRYTLNQKRPENSRWFNTGIYTLVERVAMGDSFLVIVVYGKWHIR